MLTFSHLNTAINNIYSEHNWRMHGGMSTTFPVHINAYDYLCLNAIKIYFEQNNFKPIAEACSKAADHCFTPYQNQLGTYFRNAYYILEMASNSIRHKNIRKYSGRNCLNMNLHSCSSTHLVHYQLPRHENYT